MKFVECPRDAMQGMKEFIPTENKVKYINQILKVGFDTVDAGSFVSPKAIPQMADTSKVLKRLDMANTISKILVIVANKRGAEDAVSFDEVSYLGFPFSISETFQKRNINSTIEESLRRLGQIQNLCVKNNKELVTYFSMAFGNPYGDEWSPDIVANWAERLYKELGVKKLSLSDTIGSSTPETITYLFNILLNDLAEVEVGAHLHTTIETAVEKIEAAVNSGCTRFDSAIKGFGGCPMAKDELVGNMPTEKLLDYFDEKNVDTKLNIEEFGKAYNMTNDIFPR